MPFLDIDGLSIRYSSNITDQTIKSEKPTVVLFHGNAFSLDNWSGIDTMNLLAKEGYPVFAIDLPAGRGSKSSKLEKKNLSEYVPILDSIFAKLNIQKNSLIIIGPSMGGGFALAYAIAHADSVSGLVLIGPSIRDLDESQFSHLEMPVLLIWGEKDNVFPVEEHGESLKKALPRAKLLIIKGAGHAAYLDKPSEFHDLLIDFLNEIT